MSHLQANAASQSQAQQSVDPQTYQAQTAGELTYGKKKAQDMLALKRGSGNGDSQGGLAQPQDVTGDQANVHSAAQSVDAATQPSEPDQVSRLCFQTAELFLTQSVKSQSSQGNSKAVATPAGNVVNCLSGPPDFKAAGQQACV